MGEPGRIEKIFNILKSPEVRNSYWNAVDIMNLPFLMLLATPFFIWKLGIEQYGIWMLVNSIVAGFGVFNADLSSATIRYVSKYRAARDDGNIVGIIRTTYSLNLVFLLVMVVAGIAASHLIDAFNLFKVNPDYRKILLSSIRLASIFFGLKLLEQNILSVFKGFERYDLSSQISMVSRLLLIAAQAVAAGLGLSLAWIFACSIIMTLLVLTAEAYSVKRFYSGIRFSPYFDMVYLREVFDFGVWSWLQSILGIIAAQIDRYLVAAYAGAIYLGYYSIASAVAMQLHAFFSAGAHWLFPYVSRKVEHNIDVTHIYYKAQTAVVFAGVAAITLIFCLRDPLFGLWLGNITYPNSKRLIEMFLYFNILMVPTIVPYYFFLGSGYIRLSTILILISTVMTILFMAAGFSAIGNLGLIAGKITAVIIVSPLLLRFLHNRVLGETGVFAGIKLFLPSMLAVLALSLRTPLYSGALFVLALAAFRLFCPDRRSSAMPRMA